MLNPSIFPVAGQGINHLISPIALIHVPHSSTLIPSEYRGQFVLSDNKLAAKRVRMTNSCTVELFALPVRHLGAVSRQPVGSGSGTV